MKALWATLVLSLFLLPLPAAASTPGAWTLSGNGGIGVGDQTPP